jgi:hypothetical protein
MKTSRLTGILFYSLIGAWVVGIIIGMAARLPYVERKYGGVTLPLFAGVMLLAMAAANYGTGSIWRGGARTIDRHTEPGAYWVGIGVMGLVGVVLLCLGVRNWMGLS